MIVENQNTSHVKDTGEGNISESQEYILTVSCKDVRGIVATVTGFIADLGGFILDAAQFGDKTTGQFFQRIHFSISDSTIEYNDICQQFSQNVACRFSMKFNLYDLSKKARLLIMVSKFDHCLNDLLHRQQAGTLDVEIPLIISNHPDMEKLAKWYDVPYLHLPIEGEGKDKLEQKKRQEERIAEEVEKHNIDLVVLARYMQILSPELCKKLEGRAINIHHSFLPSFKGARPYHQAHAKGVKLIGATAHYVTSDLDEGPIIEQEVVRVDHKLSIDDFIATGQDIERRVLYRAVKYHIEHRVMLNKNKTVVF